MKIAFEIIRKAASKLIQEKIIGKGHIKLQNAVADIQDKQKDIYRLEQVSINISTLIYKMNRVFL